MTVYVDQCIHPWRGRKWAHMYADTLDELHAMATRVGLRRAWFQDDWRLPHYDVVIGKRALAIHYGAVAVEQRFTGERVRAAITENILELPK